MQWYRFYIDKKITDAGGGDLSRVIDLELELPDFTKVDDRTNFLLQDYQGKLDLADDEVLTHVAELAWDPS